MTRSFHLHLNDQAVPDKRGRYWLFGRRSSGVHKFRSDAVHLQFCCQNLVTGPNWYSTLFGKLLNGQTSICDLHAPGCRFCLCVDVGHPWNVHATWNIQYVSWQHRRKPCWAWHMFQMQISRVVHNISLQFVAASGCPFSNPTNEKYTLYLIPCSLSTNEDICDTKTAF